MSQYFRINPNNPQERLLRQAAVLIKSGALIVYPTEIGYALGGRLGCRRTLERLRQLRQLGPRHLFTIVCGDLSQLGRLAQVSNRHYRLIKRLTPGPYTWVLQARRSVPRSLLHAKRSTIGLRVTADPVAQGLLAQLAAPMVSCSLTLPDHEASDCAEPEAIRQTLGRRVDLVIGWGPCEQRCTTVLDLTADQPTLIRLGAGPWSAG